MIRLVSSLIAAVIGCASFVNAQSDELNPFVKADPQVISGVLRDYYPVVFGGPVFTHYIAVSCIEPQPPGNDCLFDICAVPGGTTDLNCSFSNSIPRRGLRLYNAADLPGLRGGWGQVFVNTSTAYQGASKAYLSQPCGCFVIDDPIQLPIVIPQ